ncbi:MAG: hypothetical protein J0M11_13140 [Anaerolineae bacterium]|nr:hypothetical protein [Anaerolineae bacterium]
MDIIYSASALGAFSNSLIYIGFFFFLGLGGLLLNYLPKRKRKEKFIKRHSLGCLSILILFFGVTTTIATYNTFTGGDKTVHVQVLEKEEVTRKCNKSYCTYYVVEATDGAKLYLFGLEKDTWEKMEVEACYQFTYYPLKPLLADYLQEDSQYPSLYEATGYITLIGKVEC